MKGPTPPEDQEITALLKQLQAANLRVEPAIFPLLYDELYLIAKGKLKRERPNHTLNPTALINEAYLKIVEQQHITWANRSHFLGIAALVMHRILVKYARQASAEKRGGGREKVTLKADMIKDEVDLHELLAIDDAIKQLEAASERSSKVFIMRFFGGLQMEEIAEALSISERTAKRDWKTARLWLSKQLTLSLG